MTQTEKRLYLIRELMKEDPKYGEMKIPDDEQSQKNMLRALFNLRMPEAADKEFLLIQDTYLQEEIRRKGITDLADLKPTQQDLYLWKGDITTLK